MKMAMKNMKERNYKAKTVFKPFPKNPWFLHVYFTSLLKMLWEKGSLQVMSNFSFSHSFLEHARDILVFVSCQHDMTEIRLKALQNPSQSIRHQTLHFITQIWT